MRSVEAVANEIAIPVLRHEARAIIFIILNGLLLGSGIGRGHVGVVSIRTPLLLMRLMAVYGEVSSEPHLGKLSCIYAS